MMSVGTNPPFLFIHAKALIEVLFKNVLVKNGKKREYYFRSGQGQKLKISQ